MNRKNLILVSIILILAVFYGLTFIVSGKKNKGEEIQSSLINKKFNGHIKEFELSSGDTVLYFVLNNGFWFCTDGTSDFIPCENKKISAFFDELMKVRKMKKINNGGKSFASYGFSEEGQFKIKYETDENQFYEIYFGDKDFSGSARYVMSGKNLNVYEINTAFDPFLYTGSSHWSDPFILSRNFESDLSKIKIERILFTDYILNKSETISRSNNEENFYKLTEYRHGGALKNLDVKGNLLSEMKIELGDTSLFNLSFYEIMDSENSFAVKVEYHFSENKNTPALSYSVKISKWTYNKLKEII